MNQQVGDGEEVGQKSNYGRSVDEAKALIKQLEAFKHTAPTVDNSSAEAEPPMPADLDNSPKNDVRFVKLQVNQVYTNTFKLDGYL